MRHEPAFPCTTYNEVGQEVNAPGMDLRDWFAGMALQGMLSNPVIAERYSSDHSELVGVAYGFADEAIRMKEGTS